MAKYLAITAILLTACGVLLLFGQATFNRDAPNSQIAAKEAASSEVRRDANDELPAASKIDANDLFYKSLEEAKRQNKNVLLVFDGPSCSWCKVLKKFLAQQAEFLEKDYIIVHIDVGRMENGKLIKKKFTSDASVPWTAIVNPSGDVLCTSVGDKGNIGCPIAVEDCEHFVSMIEQSAIRSQKSDREKFARELKDFAEPIRLTSERENESQDLDAGPWIGEWINVDASTQDITRFVVQLDGTNLSIHAFGKCEPTDCDWGTVELRLCRVDGSKNETRAFGKWDHGFSETYMILRWKDESISAETITIFKDQSGREGSVTTETFGKAVSQGSRSG
jgi:thioredoxin-related protein